MASPLLQIAALLVLSSSVGADVLRLNLDNFMNIIDGPHHKIVKFYAPWCSMCTAIEPHFLKTSDSYPVNETNIIFAQVDGSEESFIADELGVTNYPTFIHFPADAPDEYEQIAMGSSLAEMHSVVNHRFNFSHRLPVPEVPELVLQLNTTEDFEKAVLGRTGHLVVNVYGEACPHDCLRMHMNLPVIASIFKNDDISFTRLHGHDNVGVVRRFNALFYPSIIFFPKIEEGVTMHDSEGKDFNHLTYSESKTDPVELLNWLNVETGLRRSETGGLLLEAGNIPTLDELINASSSLTDGTLVAALEQAVAGLPPHDQDSRYPSMASAYLDVARNIVEKGEVYVTSEMARYEEAVLEEGIGHEALDDLHLAHNVLKVFNGKIAPAYHSTFSGSEEGADVGEL